MARPSDSDPVLASRLVAAGDGASEIPPDGGDYFDADRLDEARAAATDRSRARLWWAGSVLYRRRWWIVGATVLAAIASVAISLQIPNRYRAETRVLMPEDGGGGLMASALSSISPTAAALLSGGGAGFTRYMAILSSPSTMASVVERFDLVDRYELQDEDHPFDAAVRELTDRAQFEVALDFDYLGISVLDEDPETAAQMANYFVARLNERNIEFQSSSAADNRVFLKRRLDQANADLDSAQAELQSLQERSGVVEPTAQAEALFSALAASQAEVATAEVQFQALLSQFGPDNPDVQSARAGLQAARGQVDRLRGGAEAGLPGLSGLPRVQRQYAEVLQELEIQRAIIETVQPLYEQAALQEQRDADAVQVLDPATPPARKAEPRRSLLVIGATLSVGLLAVVLALVVAWIRQRLPSVLARLEAGA
ncbi:GumC family protein [Rubrivirga marina]|uniref:GumC family protein n=1 Tax=Rubrivirga marina TaxID=1196024 RepID=UPI000BA9223A|nr:Wzz/FepE/Etk N-terminal domain-containing protein [Rubrivirga marina]